MKIQTATYLVTRPGPAGITLPSKTVQITDVSGVVKIAINGEIIIGIDAQALRACSPNQYSNELAHLWGRIYDTISTPEQRTELWVELKRFIDR